MSSPDLQALEQELAALVGAEAVLAGAPAGAFAVDRVDPSIVVRPGTQAEVAQVVGACARAGVAVAAWGGGTAVGTGNPPARLDVVVALDRLTGVVEYDHANLNVSAEAGLRLTALQEVLATQREFLPLDPASPDQMTVGGLVATNQSGPARLLYGTARDWILGMRVVLPSGERIRCGGKVIKNVSGYDMNKLLIGSLGTLGIITEVTFKLLPEAEQRATVFGVFPDLSLLPDLCRKTLASQLLPEALEALDHQALAQVASAVGVSSAAGYGLAVALAGSQETVARQVRDFERLFTAGGASAVSALPPHHSRAAWRAITDVHARVPGTAAERAVVKVAVPIGKTLELMKDASDVARRYGWRGAVTAHAGSGVVRATYVVPDAAGAHASLRDELEALRVRAELVEGSLVLEAAPPGIKHTLDAWGGARDGFAVMKRLKAELDPRGMLSPGRFLGGI